MLQVSNPVSVRCVQHLHLAAHIGQQLKCLVGVKVGSVDFFDAEFSQLNVHRGTELVLRQRSANAGEGATVDGDDGATFRHGLFGHANQLGNVAPHAGNALHFRAAFAVQANCNVVGQLSCAGAT